MVSFMVVNIEIYSQQLTVRVDLHSCDTVKLSKFLSSVSFEYSTIEEYWRYCDSAAVIKNRYLPSYKSTYHNLNSVGTYQYRLFDRGDSYIFHFTPQDTVFVIDKITGKMSSWLIFDFGEYGYKDNLNLIDTRMYPKYVKSHYRNAGYIENFAVFDNVIYFTYRYNDTQRQVLYNTITGHMFSGVIICDLLVSPLSDSFWFHSFINNSEKGIKIGSRSVLDLNRPEIRNLCSDSELPRNGNNQQLVLFPHFENF